MDGTNTERLLQSASDGTSTEAASAVPDICDAVEDVCVNITETEQDSEQTVPELTANAENTEVPAASQKTGFLSIVRRSMCGILALSGVVSYGYVGFSGINYLQNGGFGDILSKRVFGGSITAIAPVQDNDDAAATGDNRIPDNSADAEYVEAVSENIGCAEPYTVFNETKYDTGADAVQAAAAIPEFRDGGTVLIIHTHGTEGYAPEDGVISAEEDFRTSDTESSVVAVGSAFAEVLVSRGINTVHCTTMFDEESYIEAYSRSAEAVSQYMEEYPDIMYVIDIHRDAVIRQDGTVVRSDNGSGAQLMIVCGTDEMGADFPDWRENFAFGAEYQNRLFEKDSRLVRHMNLRSASFNQQLCERYLLLEVGTCGNTLPEAVASAKTAAEVFADMILGE